MTVLLSSFYSLVCKKSEIMQGNLEEQVEQLLERLGGIV